MRILIADDEFNTRRGIHSYLERHYNGAHELIIAEHGLEAYEIAQSRRIDLLITDIRMPGLTGIELLIKLQAEEADMTALLLTGYADFEYARQGLKLGVVDYLLKPVERTQLIEAVEQAFKARHRKKAGRMLEALYAANGDAEPAQLNVADNEPIAKAVEYLQAHLGDESSIKDVAQHVHLSPSYFSVLFKDKTGTTFSEYVMRLRHRRAKELLLTTASDINVIADEVGYQSASYFIRVFKELEGVTPRQYRESLKKAFV